MAGSPRGQVEIKLIQLGTCSVRTRVDGRFVQCTEQAVHAETHVDPGCPDDPGDGPHVSELLYCAGHRHHASSTGSKPWP